MSAKSAETSDMLARQPASIIGLDDAQRDEIVISAIRDGDRDCVLSVYAHPLWKLAPFIKNANKQESAKTVDWSQIPPSFLAGIQAILYRYWKVGGRNRSGLRRRPSLATSITFARS